MSQTVKLSDDIIRQAKRHAAVNSRSLPKQIEHWFKIGRMAEENPDLPYGFVKDVLLGLEENTAGEVKPYRFGKP